MVANYFKKHTNIKMLERFDLQRAVSFSQKISSDHEYVLNLSEQIWQRLDIDKTKKVQLKKECLVTTLINLRNGWLTGTYMRYSRTPNYYNDIPRRYKREYFTYNLMCGVLTGLNENGYTIEFKGFKNPRDNFAQQTKIRTTDRFNQDITQITNDMIKDIEPPELIVLRGRGKSGIRLEYKDTSETKRLRNELREYNELRQSTDITINNTLVSDKKSESFLKLFAVKKTETEIQLRSPYIYRVFNQDFNMGGRFYNGIESNMPKALRKNLYINGKQTVELDYSGLHIRMLYNLESINPPGNCYDDLANGNPELRKLYKLIALVSINAGSEKKAFMAIRHSLINSDLKTLLPDLTDNSIKYFYDNWLNTHPKISKYFNSDIGIKLQNYDSKISSRIIKHFTKKTIPILVVHDSFIINEEYKEQLEEIMKREYKFDFGFEAEVN